MSRNQKGDLQVQDIQLDMINPEDPKSWDQFIEWAKQISARQKELQRQVDRLDNWVFPK